MKITLNANITPDTITGFLEKQNKKTEKIKEFCVKNKINELSYKDSELEFEYEQTTKVETRPKQSNKEVR